MVKVSDFIIKSLEDIGVDTIFTVSGGGCMHLLDSLSRSTKIKYVCTHHEQAAAMAAEGYSRMTGKLGVILVTTGPGGINALNGVMGAWLDSIPMLIISGQVSLSQTSENSGCRQIGDQEFPIVPMVKHMTKYAEMVRNKDSIGHHLNQAIVHALTGRPGPVWIDVPLDIQGSTVNEQNVNFYNTLNRIYNQKIYPINAHPVVDMIKSSSKPLIVVGNGMRLSAYGQDLLQDLLRDFSMRFRIPVMTNCHSAVDLVNESDPYYCGRYGIFGQRSSNKIIQECDLLISIGSRLIMKTTGYNVHNFAKNAKKIVVDIDQNEMDKHRFKIDLKIQSDAYVFLSNVLAILNSSERFISNKGWVDYCRKLREEDVFVFPKHRELKNCTSMYYFVDRLGEHLRRVGSNIPVVLSNGSAHVITHHAMKMYGNQRVFTNVGCASMGYGLPAAIGACFGNNKNQVICIEGDGSIMMNLQELQTVRGYNLPLKIFVINNKGYASIKQTQNTFFDGHLAGSTPETGVTFPRFRDVALTFGMEYLWIGNNFDVEYLIKRTLDTQGPCLCEIDAHPSEPFEPKVTPKGIDADGKIIPGDLENMYVSDEPLS